MGASLYMWRDFFPNAQIFGADDYPETLFEDDRIKTFLCDERKKEDIVELIKNTGSDIDLFIDDAIHNSRRQIFLAKKENVDSVELTVNKDNLPAKKLYQKTGFEKTHKDYYRLILNSGKPDKIKYP